MKTSAEIILKKYWGYDQFRPYQYDIISSVLEKKNTIGLLTTGGGKSICFQVPALMTEGICIVISPLVALMKDQVYQLRKRNIPAATIYQGLSPQYIEKIYEGCIENKIKFLYISPERLGSKAFIQQLMQMKIGLIAIDESHCISQWGYDFRPSYLQIPQIYNACNFPPVVALTATATPRVLEDIKDKLEFQQCTTVKSSFYKPNLTYFQIDTEQKLLKTVDIIRKHKGGGLIYVNKRNSAEELKRTLEEYHIKSQFYHAGLSMEERNLRQETWQKSPDAIMICTNAFGMGIDNPNVRFVVHYDMPDSLENYFQEAGRAGRDGRESVSYTLISKSDIIDKKDKINAYPTINEVKQTFTFLCNYYDLPFEQGKNMTEVFSFELFIAQYKLHRAKTEKCLQILVENQLIYIESAFFKPDKLQILIDHSQLNAFYHSYKEYEQLIKQLIRAFEGLFYLRNVDLNYFAKSYHYNLMELKKTLKILHEKQIVLYQASTSQPTLTFLENKTLTTSLTLNNKLYYERKNIYTTQLECVINYLTQKKTCRSIFLLDYFGEKNQQLCQKCDIDTVSMSKIGKEDYLKIKNTILENLDHRIFIGIDKLLKINKEYREYHVRRVLDRLTELELIEKGNGEMFKLK